MSKYLTKEESAEYFISAITQGQSESQITVKEVDESGEIIFESDDENATFLQTILNAPKRLVNFIYHAITNKEEEIEQDQENVGQELLETNTVSSSTEENTLNISTQIQQEEEVGHILGINDRDILKSMFTERMMSNLSINEFSSSNLGCIEQVSDSPSVLWAKRKVSNFELIQLALSNQNQVKKILLGQSPKIDSENDIQAEDSVEYTENLLLINREDKQVTCVFNVTAFKKMFIVNLKCNLSDYSPIISKILSGKHEGNYSINFEHLKAFIGKQVAEVIFNPEYNQDKLVLKSVMLPSIKPSEEELKNKVLVKLVLDVSGSMTEYMSAYIKNVQKVVAKVMQSADNWQIDVALFNSESSTHSFSSEKHCLEDINGFLSLLKSGGGTKLFGTMYEELTNLGTEAQEGFDHTVFIIFTDGVDNQSGSITSEDINGPAIDVRENISNLQMFSMELGNSNKSFFEHISTEAGFTHIQLEEIDDFRKFDQYVSGFLKNTVILKMLNESLKVWAQQVGIEGEISVGNFDFSPNSKFMINDIIYSISDPSEDFNEVLGENLYIEE